MLYSALARGLEVDTVLQLDENFTVTFFRQETKFDWAKICLTVHLDRRPCCRFFQPRVTSLVVNKYLESIKKLVNVKAIVSFTLPFFLITSFEARSSFERS